MLACSSIGLAHVCQLCVQESDDLLQRQFGELSKGLQDEAPAVRMTAAGGICSLLNLYWELIPAATTAAYLKRLTGHPLLTHSLTHSIIHFSTHAFIHSSTMAVQYTGSTTTTCVIIQCACAAGLGTSDVMHSAFPKTASFRNNSGTREQHAASTHICDGKC